MKKLLVIALFLAAGLTGCRSSERAQWSALGTDQKVTLYGLDGHIIRQWVSDGKVSTEGNSDGWYFKDHVTGKLVRVTGTVVIESQ